LFDGKPVGQVFKLHQHNVDQDEARSRMTNQERQSQEGVRRFFDRAAAITHKNRPIGGDESKESVFKQMTSARSAICNLLCPSAGYGTLEAEPPAAGHDGDEKVNTNKRATFRTAIRANKTYSSTKIDLARERIQQILNESESNSILVFCHLLTALDCLEAALELEEDHICDRYDSTVSKKKRIALQQKWHGDAPPLPSNNRVMLLTGCGTEAATLTKAHHVVILAPWWNPAVETQGIGRAGRYSQIHGDIFVWTFAMPDSIEQYVLKVQKRKLARERQLFDPFSDEFAKRWNGPMEGLRGFNFDQFKCLVSSSTTIFVLFFHANRITVGEW
jgi:SNF2 family DNA or RNA helicase